MRDRDTRNGTVVLVWSAGFRPGFTNRALEDR